MSPSLVTILVLQWVGLIGLTAVVFAMVRQIGILHQRIAPAGALMISRGLEIGAQVPAMSLHTLDGTDITLGAPGTHSTLIMFVAPDCPVCARLIPALIAIARQERSWLQVVFASDGQAADHARFRHDKGLDGLPYVVSTELGLTFQVAKLPFGVLIDENGLLVSQGLTNSREHIESLFESKRLQVATIQDFLAKRGSLPSSESLNG